ALGSRVDCRSDLFSVGIMAWEMATKRRFWREEKDGNAILERLVTGDFERSPRAVAPDVDPQLDAICQRALAQRADDRYASAAESRFALETFLEDRTGGQRKDIGKYVLDRFGSEKNQIGSIIQSQLADLARTSEVKPVSLVPAPLGVEGSDSLKRPAAG